MHKPKFIDMAASFIVLGLMLFLVLGCTKTWRTAGKPATDAPAKKKIADSRHVVV